MYRISSNPRRDLPSPSLCQSIDGLAPPVPKAHISRMNGMATSLEEKKWGGGAANKMVARRMDVVEQSLPACSPSPVGCLSVALVLLK